MRITLCQILEPNRHILFGEWLFAKHSKHYTSLPAYFIAFDIYDKVCMVCMPGVYFAVLDTWKPLNHQSESEQNPNNLQMQ